MQNSSNGLTYEGLYSIMKKKNILITGGAGFIGSHLADSLMADGHRVRVLDNLCSQVHGDSRTIPEYLPDGVEFMFGDIRDKQAVDEAVEDMEVVYHFAARVGVGQSMYEIREYTDVNNLGTAVLLESLLHRKSRPEKLIVASSMSIYGEGLYRPEENNFRGFRDLAQLKAGMWELTHEKTVLSPIPTPETKQPMLSSVYALSKYDQERLCLIIGQAHEIPTVALRFFNVYGTRQSLSNPYTGVLAIFASRYLNHKPPVIFEDGFQRRDFVSVHDVVQACRLVMNNTQVAHEVFNIGSGEDYTVKTVAELISRELGKEEIMPHISGKYRMGDIRHCFADIGKARRQLGYAPRISLKEGFRELAEWLQDQIAIDRVEQATGELEQHGLTI
jgi:dTDP-L-rhamnose 4-epimerase